jgi:type I restriction enzyme, S subunit
MTWREVPLGEVATLQRGYDLPERERKPGNVPVVTSAGISGSHNEARSDGPGVVTGRYGTLGQVYFITEDFWPHNTTLFVKDFHGNDRRFVYYLLGSMALESKSSVSAVPGVNRNDLHRLRVMCPPLPIQRRVAEILGRLDDKIEVHRRINRTLEAMAQALYKEWFVDFGPFQDGEFVESELGLIPKGWGVKGLSEVYNLTMGTSPKSEFGLGHRSGQELAKRGGRW